ncbi:MAG: iron-containing alcohol dehydrogenase [Lentihominibacter sp.]|jgi:alcohol dehydrogenase
MNLLYKTFCRTFQIGLKFGNYFLGYGFPQLIEGPGSVISLPKFIAEKGLNKVLIVAGRTTSSMGSFNDMLTTARETGLEYEIYNKVNPNPTTDNVEEGLAIYNSNSCEGIIAFGGGSPMDCAKAIGARVARPDKTVSQLQGILKVRKKLPLIFAVPTTAGTGSETTIAAVITDSITHHKASINDPAIMPEYAVLDPKLTVGLPPFITATTGMDALCHAIEAYTNHTYNTRLENQLALDAVKLIYRNLLKVYMDGTDIEARQNMQIAAFKAGRAFTRGCVGHVHAIGHTLGGLYGVPHGLAMSILLPKVMKKFGVSVHRRLAELADYSGMTKALDIMDESDKTKAQKFIEWIEETNAAMGIPDKSDKILPEDIPQLITWASAEANPLYPVPELWTREDFREVIESIST